jgi:RND family efflux transporter MFP subunit
MAEKPLSRRVQIALALVLLAVAVVASALVLRDVARTSPDLARRLHQPIPVGAVACSRTALKQVLGASGTIEPAGFVTLTARTQGRVEAVLVDVGASVEPGQVLLRFSTGVARAALRTSEAELARASSDLERALTAVERMRALHRDGLVAGPELDAAEAELASATAQKEQAEEARVRARVALGEQTVTSPVVGIVSEREVNPDETPRLDQKLFVIGRIDEVLVAARLAEAHLGSIALQQAAAVTFPALALEPVAGVVVKLAPAVDPETRTFTAYVRLPNPERRLKPGLTAFVRFETVLKDAIAVPSIALLPPAGRETTSVFVVGPDRRVALRAVRPGAAAEGSTAIEHGLSAGEMVVTVGQLSLRDGDRVRIVKD